MSLIPGNSPPFTSKVQTRNLTERVDAVIDDALGERRVVGAVVLIAKDGEMLYTRAAGFADREAGLAMTLDTLFRLSSVSKVYVSVAAMTLVDRAQLALDTPVTKWLPDFQPAAPDGSRPSITIRHLLSHTAGLSYGFLEPAYGPYHRAGVSDGMDVADVALAENVRRIGTVPLLFTPGTSWNYCWRPTCSGWSSSAPAAVNSSRPSRHSSLAPLG